MQTRRRHVLGLAVTAPLATWAAAERSGGERQRLRFTLSASNPTAQPVFNQAVWMYMPVRQASHHQLTGLQVSSAHDIQTDDLAHTIVRLAWPQLPPLATRIVTLTAEIRVFAEPQVQPLADPAPWLGPERLIETDAPAVRALAARLRNDSAAATAGAIYNWVRGNLRYAGYLADDLGALRALESLSGDCSEYAYLSAALARVNGIPARTVGGFVTSGSLVPRAEDYHSWAELHIDGAWRVLDAQKERWGPGVGAEHVPFRIYRGHPINPLGNAHRFRVDGQIEVRL